MWRTGPLASQCRCPLPRNKKTRDICAFQSMKCHVCDWQLTSCHPHLPPHTHTHTHMRYMYMSILLDYSPWLLCMCECMCVKAHRLNHGWQTKPASQYTCCVGVLPQVYKGGRLCMCMCVCLLVSISSTALWWIWPQNSSITFCYLAGNHCGSENRSVAGVSLLWI